MVRGDRREEDSGWGTQVYLWRIHVDIWQNQYNIVKLKNKIKLKKISIVIKIAKYCVSSPENELLKKKKNLLVLKFLFLSSYAREMSYFS